MSFRISDIKVLTINSRDEFLAEANRIRDLGGSESEREEKEVRIKKIIAKMVGNAMRPFDWAIAHVMEDNTDHRVNGMHSCEAVRRLKNEEWEQIKFPAYVVETTYDCKTAVDAAGLFEQFDQGWSNRSSEDKIGAHIGVEESLRDILDRTVGNAATKGITLYNKHIYGADSTEDVQFGYLHRNSEIGKFLSWSAHTLSKGKTSEMLPQEVMAAIFHTMTGNDEAKTENAQTFWLAVSHGTTGSDAGTPAHHLAGFLGNLKSYTRREQWGDDIRGYIPTNSKKPKALDVFATCLNAYSAEITTRGLENVHIPTGPGEKLSTYSDAVALFLPAGKVRAA